MSLPQYDGKIVPQRLKIQIHELEENQLIVTVSIFPTTPGIPQILEDIRNVALNSLTAKELPRFYEIGMLHHEHRNVAFILRKIFSDPASLTHVSEIYHSLEEGYYINLYRQIEGKVPHAHLSTT